MYTYFTIASLCRYMGYVKERNSADAAFATVNLTRKPVNGKRLDRR